MGTSRLDDNMPAQPRRALTGVPAHAQAAVTCSEAADRAVIVLLASNLGAAETLAEETAQLLTLLNAATPVARTLTEADAAVPAFEADCDLLGVLAALRHGGHDARRPLLIACTPASLARRAPAPEAVARAELVIRKGDRLALRDFAHRLATEFGYDHEALCEQPGEYALRGGILDVYPLNAQMPVRIDLFGDTVESLRPFDPATQRSEGEVEGLVICAPRDDTGTLAEAPFFRHLPRGTLIVTIDQCQDDPLCLAWHDTPLEELVLAETDDTPAGYVGTPLECLPAESLLIGAATDGSEARPALLRAAAALAKDGRPCLLAGDTEGSVDRLTADVAAAGIRGFKPRICAGRFGGGILVAPGKLPGLLKDGLVLLTERELFGRRKRPLASLPRRRTAVRAAIGRALDFGEVAHGDALVHATQGICLFRGIQAHAHNGRTEDFIELEFAEQSRLHLPVRESHLLSRYIGIGRTQPKLSKLGGGGWEKSRKAAEQATTDLAAQLLAMQAERSTKPGIAHPRDADNPWMGEFERSFPHRETPDQARAIADVKSDLERAAPMDRLVSGDVGFGKTEVALRAAFKCVLGGRQVAILAPTTVLAQQHFESFKERLARWPVSVELLSGYRTAKQKADVRARAAAGTVDLVVGTHALLADGTSFGKLGLVIIDEEHRFGVRHKERLKQLRSEVDVLAMSATPIPRTLYLALVGARDLSVIETPPRERLPIRTIVRSYDEHLVRDAVKAELARGGQVFYLHNRVETIRGVAERLAALLPKARIVVGHGQMGAGELEETMAAFVAGDFDVLVCTTIIETGLDIPNCNTLIIEGADRFGLAQLYQLRGRVGRFNRQAYAYLFLHRHAALVGTAHRRLSAIRQYNQLGAGFRIAMRDLELRGAGNILGAAQSGHVAKVGFDLYCQLLRRSVAKLRGDKGAIIDRCEVQLDFIDHTQAALGTEPTSGRDVTLLTATLPSDWIPETRLRIEAFRRVAMALDGAEVAELRDSLRDRYGKLPPEAEALLGLAEIRCLAEARQVVTVSTDGPLLRCEQAGRGRPPTPILVGNRFPRLTVQDPLRKLKEIRGFLSRLPAPAYR
jgi:transcription-repair coupling factor (superfamily II helicase)